MSRQQIEEKFHVRQ